MMSIKSVSTFTSEPPSQIERVLMHFLSVIVKSHCARIGMHVNRTAKNCPVLVSNWHSKCYAHNLLCPDTSRRPP